MYTKSYRETSITSIQYKKDKHKDICVQLAHIHDAPTRIFVRGELPLGQAVAIVGTRKPTVYGEEVAYRMAFELAQAGLIIVSGLAYGIDTIAHRAAVAAGGKTVAVLGCGLDVCYPAANKVLAEQIVQSGGALVSEYEEGTPPLKYHFPARNRIIAGMSLGVLVPEADARSGSLITAHLALDENRVVMAVPGAITSARSEGPNNLIRAGAVPIHGVDDVWTALGLMKPENVREDQVTKYKVGTLEHTILAALQVRAMSADGLAKLTQRPIQQVIEIMSLLELTGEVTGVGTGQWIAR